MKTRQIVAALLASSALAAPAMAQDAQSTVTPQNTVTPPSTTEPPLDAGAPGTGQTEQSGPGDDIVVTGIRASQAKSIDIKRESAAIVDAISAEDIGKLPDVTIVDSLQRISGVQIQRSAGEGATVNIRGLPQVVTLLNGEQYLSPSNLGSAQPNLNDIPAQLMSGVVVFKSQDVRNAQSGISGTIDLRTRRPFDFKNGLTLSGQGEYSTGQDTRKDNYLVSGLASFRTGRLGIMGTAAYSEADLGNNYAGTSGGTFGNNEWGGNEFANWIAPHGYDTFHREVERKRFGASGAIQWEIDDGVMLTGEGFYTKFIEHNRAAGMNISNRWTGVNWTQPLQYAESGQVSPANGKSWLDVDQYNLDAWWVNSFSVNRSIKSESKNFNLELEWDKGGPFTFTARGIYADADYLNTNGQVQGDLSNWRASTADGSIDHTFTLFRNAADPTRGTFYPANIASQYPASQYTNAVVGSRGGRYVDPNPLGYARDPQLQIDISGRNAVWSGFDTPIGGGLGPNSTLRDYMSNLDSYTVAAYSSEGNNHNKSDLYAFRLDGAFDFEKLNGKFAGILKRIDAGVRGSRRKTSISVYHLFSNFYAGNGAENPNGCAVQWKAIDVAMDNPQCRAGELVPNPAFDTTKPASADNPASIFQGYTVNRPTNLAANNNTYFLDDFGSVTKGFPGVWVADPHDFDDPVAFQNRVFGNTFPVIIPGSSYDVNFYERSAYANAVLELGNLTGNVGVKVIQTKIRVRQNLTGATVAYGDTNIDTGDFFDGNKYTDVLPTVNLQWNVNDRLKLRAAFAETMIPLDLGNYGGGLSISTADSSGPTAANPNASPRGVRQVTGASSSGNPGLNPWRSNNYDAAIEYYLGRATLLNVGVFQLDINSFVTTQTINDGQFPDADGVVRRTVPFTRPVQGEGGSLQGVEVGARVALSDFLETDSFIRNFGLDANYTYSDSSQRNRDLTGEKLPFFDNSREQVNAALWYQDERLQARIAYNYRTPRLSGTYLSGAVNGENRFIPIFQDATQYVDANVTFAFTDNFSIYANGSNIFGEIEKYYYQFDKDSKQFSARNEFEPRYSIGIRAKF